jgi:hypothetical protein
VGRAIELAIDAVALSPRPALDRARIKKQVTYHTFDQAFDQ